MRQRHKCRFYISLSVFCIVILSNFCPLDVVTRLRSSLLRITSKNHPTPSLPHLLPFRDEYANDQNSLQQQQELQNLELLESLQHEHRVDNVDNIALDAQVAKGNHRNADEVRVHVSKNSSINQRHSKPVFISVVPQGGLGNAMFQYAALLGIGQRANLTLVLPEDSVLRSVFNVTTSPLPPAATAEGEDHAWFTFRERWPCAYDEDTELLSDRFYSNDVIGVRLQGFFQSWRYFRDCRARVREEFAFLPSVQRPALAFIRQALRSAFGSKAVTWRRRTNRIRANNNNNNNNNSNNNNNTLTIVGVHVRRGDMRTKHNARRGYTVATPAYIRTAMSVFEKEAAATLGGLTRSRSWLESRSKPTAYILYIVCSDDIEWSRAHIGYGTEGGKVNVADGKVKVGDVVSDIKGQVKDVSDRTTTATGSEVKVKVKNGENEARESKQIDRKLLNLNKNETRVKNAVDNANEMDGDRETGSAGNEARIKTRTAVVYSEANTDAVDMAILAQCDHVISTVGTFSWWAGWLAGGAVTYYAPFPRSHSPLAEQFNQADYWPANWIGLS